MGKKGNWFSALKRAFTTSPKDNIIPSNPDKRTYLTKEKKKWGIGKTKNGESNAFIPLYREPSSIEKILEDADREQLHHQVPPKPRAQYLGDDKRNQQHKIRHDAPKMLQHLHLPSEEPRTKVLHFQTSSQEPVKRVQHLKPLKPRTNIAASHRRSVSPAYAQISAIKIQSAFRGYMERKRYRALKGLVRLQRAMRGQSVKRQTTNTMKCMQLLVRVQTQVRTRRLQMIESKNLQQHHQNLARSEKEMEGNFSKWRFAPQSEAEADELWDDSVLTKDERDARMRRKVEAVIKRERALAYAYSHQLLKVTPKSAHAVLSDVRTGGYPWWWSWLDRQLLHETQPSPIPKTPPLLTPKFTPATPSSFRPSSRSQPKRDVFDVLTPRSSKGLASPRTKHSFKATNKWNQNQLKDDDSLTSCPPFRPVPNYMTPTVSAKAKVRDTQEVGADGGKKRFSFSLTQSIGSLRWGKGPLFAGKEPPAQVHLVSKPKHRSSNSIGGVSVDSTVSLPAGVGRKPFR